MSIHPILEKIKGLTQKEEFTTILMIFIIILVGLAGFGLGRLSSVDMDKTIKIEYGKEQIKTSSFQNSDYKNTANVIDSTNMNIVASKNGTKYYFSWCGGVGRIQDQNKIYFNSEKEALDAGYTKATGCK